MNPFFSLRDFLFPPSNAKTKEDFEIPFGLSPSEWSRLKDLVEDDSFDLFLRALDSQAKLSVEAVLGSSSDTNLHFHRGVVTGIRKAAFLIHEIRRDERLFLEDKKNRESRAVNDRSYNLALYGSPGWRPQSQRGARGA